MTALQGDTIASALYAAGIRTWRYSRARDARGLFCGIGVCFDCLVTVDGIPDQRACQTLVVPGMVVKTNLKG
jgi:predicted molibdopterin-dependent oxidoreductase YjgC